MFIYLWFQNKLSLAMPLLKKHIYQPMNNYRPVSKLNFVSRIIEKSLSKLSQKLAERVGPQRRRAGLPYAGVRLYGDGVHSPRVASAVVQSGGTWYTIRLVINGT